MPIQMTDFKTIYKDQVFNVLSVCPIFDGNMENNQRKIKFVEAMYINEDGEIRIIQDEAWCFKFVRR